MRISVQLRAVNRNNKPERWQRSVYVDSSDRELVVIFDDMIPIGATETGKPPLDRVHSILFVADTVNTRRGSSGQLWIARAALEK
jgi:hypothetical protein